MPCFLIWKCRGRRTLSVHLSLFVEFLCPFYLVLFYLCDMADDGRNISSFVWSKFSVTCYGSNTCWLCFCEWLVIELPISFFISGCCSGIHGWYNFYFLFFIFKLKRYSSLHDWKVCFHEFFQSLEMCETSIGQYLLMVWWLSLALALKHVVFEAKSSEYWYISGDKYCCIWLMLNRTKIFDEFE